MCLNGCQPTWTRVLARADMKKILSLLNFNILPFAIRRDENTTLRIYYHILFVPSSFLVGGFSIYLPWPLELTVTTTLLCVPSPHCTQTRCCRPRSVARNVECVQNMKFYLRSAAAASLPRSLFSSSQYLQLGIYLLFPSSGSHQTPVPHITWEEKYSEQWEGRQATSVPISCPLKTKFKHLSSITS